MHNTWRHWVGASFWCSTSRMLEQTEFTRLGARWPRWKAPFQASMEGPHGGMPLVLALASTMGAVYYPR